MFGNYLECLSSHLETHAVEVEEKYYQLARFHNYYKNDPNYLKEINLILRKYDSSSNTGAVYRIC